MRRERRAENLRRIRKSPLPEEISVEELVLHGYSASEGQAVGSAFSHELGRLAAESGLSAATSREIPFLQTENVMIAASAKPDGIGAQIAKAVHGVIAR